MKFEIYGKNVTVTEGMKTKIEKKLNFLEKYVMIEEETLARVVVKVYPSYQKIEITINSKVGILRSEVKHEDLYAAIDLSIDKLEDQIRRQKTRLSRKHKDKLAHNFIEDMNIVDEKDTLVRTKQISADLMDLDEAIIKMNMLDHSFFVYTDAETEKVAIVYKRLDGNYGLLETN